jgi:Family of unknown function (DUF6092)
MTKSTPENVLFELAIYLIACARLVVDENLGLASFRLVEGASRLLASASDLGVPRDAFLQAELPVIDAEKMRVMHDLDGYVAALDEIQARFVEEAKRRNVAESQVLALD